MKRGAADYVTKPFEVDALRIKVRQLLAQPARSSARSSGCARRSKSAQRLGGLLGRSAAMHEVFRTIERVAAVARDGADPRRERHGQGAGRARDPRARRRAPGARSSRSTAPRSPSADRERALRPRARRLHRRARAPHRPLRGGLGRHALPRRDRRAGAAVQAKLLRALQERRIERLGGGAADRGRRARPRGDQPRPRARGRAGPLPRRPLLPHPRGADRAAAAARAARGRRACSRTHFLARTRARASGRGPGCASRPSALAALERYAWPGNVRELENAIERAVALSDGDVLERRRPARRAIAQAARIEALREAVRAGALGFEEATADFERELLLEALERSGLEPDARGRAARHHAPRAQAEDGPLGSKPPRLDEPVVRVCLRSRRGVRFRTLHNFTSISMLTRKRRLRVRIGTASAAGTAADLGLFALDSVNPDRGLARRARAMSRSWHGACDRGCRSRPANGSPADERRTRPTVLVVDDERGPRESLRMILSPQPPGAQARRRRRGARAAAHHADRR